MVARQRQLVEIGDDRRIRVPARPGRRTPGQPPDVGETAFATPLLQKQRQRRISLAAQDEIYKRESGESGQVDGGSLRTAEQNSALRSEERRVGQEGR